MWNDLLRFIEKDRTLNSIVVINGVFLVIMFILILFVLPSTEYFPAHINIFGQVDGYSVKEMKYVLPFIPLVMSFLSKEVSSRFKLPLLTFMFVSLNLVVLIYIFQIYL